MDIKHAKVRDQHDAGNIQLAGAASEDNRADIFTKALAQGPHQKCIERPGVRSINDSSPSL